MENDAEPWQPAPDQTSNMPGGIARLGRNGLDMYLTRL
jgi:hypothetical protein